MPVPTQPGASVTIGRMDLRLAAAFGAIILALMLIAAGAASHLYITLNRQEEDRLAGTIARILDQAVNKVAFSGKYHTRLLIEEMKATVPDLELISVESAEGTVIAHSDPSRNGTTISPEQTLPIPTTGEPAISEKSVNGHPIKEVVIPYRSGADERVLGVIRIGLNIESARRAHHRNLIQVLVLIALLTAVAMWAVMLLSRRFGGAIRTLAVQLQGITDSAQDAIIMVDSCDSISFWNPAAERILGYRPVEAIGRNLHDLLAPEHDAAVHWTTIAESLEPGWDNAIGQTVELAVRRKDGREIAVALSLSAVSIEGTRHAVGILRDITERKRAEEALRESGERFRSIIAVSNTGAWEYHLKTDYLWCSPEYFTMLGCDPRDFPMDGRANLNETWLDLLHPDDRDQVGRHFAEYLAEGSVGMYENRFRMRYADGSWIWIWSRGRTLRNPDGSLTDKTVGTHINVTENWRAEEALRQNRNMLNEVLNTIPQSVFWKDKESRYLGCNLQFAHAAGLEDPDAIVGRTDLDLPWPREEAEAYRSDDRFVMDSRCPRFHTVEPLQQADGTRIWIDTTKTPLIDGQGEVYGVLGVYEDITDRRQAEEALRTSELKLRSLFAAMRDVVIVLDAEGRYVEIAPTAAELFYRPPDQLLGKTLAEVLPKELADRFMTSIHEVLDEGSYRPMDYLMEIAGQPIWFSASIFRYTPDSVLWVAHDITERKRAEEEKEKLQAQLTQAQKMESVGRLAGGVAHDFNNMLGVILGHAELAQERIGTDTHLRADLEEIRKAARRSADLTRQLLAFARKQTVAPKMLDLNETVESMLKMLRRLIGEDIDLAWLPRGNLGAVFIDPSQVDQILANLCVNARDAIAGTGKVSIETDRASFDEAYCAEHPGFVPGEYVLLAVSDNGCGMDADTLSHVFEPFFTTKETGKGTGLGLATVYGIAKQNNGFISVYSEPGHGTSFKIYLPRHAAGSEEHQEDGKSKVLARGFETILLAEDEPAVLRMTVVMLERLGYGVLAAQTSSEAIRLARAHSGQIDLLMTDVVMPEMNGRDLAHRVLETCPEIRCLFVSGYTAEIIAHEGVLSEGVHFIQKPFSIEELAAKVREALGYG